MFTDRKSIADTIFHWQIAECCKRKIANGESILLIVVIKNPGNNIGAVLMVITDIISASELRIEMKCTFAGDSSGLVCLMATFGFFQPAAEITEYILVVRMGVRYYVGKGLKHSHMFFQKLRTLSAAIFFTPAKWTTKKAKRKPELRMKTESRKNGDCKFKVLFVCTGNAYRSPICEALLKKLRPDLEVDSAGTKITSKITKEALEYLISEDAIQYLKKTPESIGSKQLEQYDIIIAMEQRHRDSVLKNCPECKTKVVVWYVRDKIPFLRRRTEKINNQMKKNVTEYAGSLA